MDSAEEYVLVELVNKEIDVSTWTQFTYASSVLIHQMIEGSEIGDLRFKSRFPSRFLA